MIVVIADDFTGAAELAGMGLRYRLQVEVNTEVNTDTRAQLLVVTTDTRSMKEAEAVAVMEKITLDVMKLAPELIYKKVDSVLRGHLLAELTAQMNVLKQQRALLVSANPHLGRTISDGTYFYHNRPIHESSFVNDPEFAITSSDVLQMLRASQDVVRVSKKEDPLASTGITVGEVTCMEDLSAWADRLSTDTLVAGAAGFFSALLDKKYGKGKLAEPSNNLPAGSPVLYVCGTTFSNSRNAISAIKAQGGPVSYMPAELVNESGNEAESIAAWAAEISSFIRKQGKAIVAVSKSATDNLPVSAQLLREQTARVVEETFRQVDIRELVVEGGSTAAAILRRLEINTFFPQQEIAPGVIRMLVKEYNGLHITVKPGSYSWPEGVWRFDQGL